MKMTVNNNLKQLADLAVRLQLDQDPYGRYLLLKLSRNPQDRKIILKLQALISSPECLARLLGRGEIPVLNILEVDGKPLPKSVVGRISLEEITTGGGSVAGETGTGKSILLLEAAASTLKCDKQVIIFDPKGLTYRPLVKRFNNLICIPWRRLNFNPLEPPPKVSRQDWNHYLSFLFAELGLIQGISAILKGLTELSRQDANPTIHDLMNTLEAAKPKSFRAKDAWIASAIGILSRIMGGSGDCFNSRDNRMIEYLLLSGECSVIIETRGLLDLENFFVSYLLIYIRPPSCKWACWGCSAKSYHS